MVDDDEIAFSAELLFAWKKQHDVFTANLMKTDGRKIRLEVANRVFKPFADVSPLAMNIVQEKDGFWEGQLTLELINRFFEPALRELRDVEADVVFGKSLVLHEGSESVFLNRKMDEAQRLVNAMKVIVENDLVAAWGENSVPGDEWEILHTTKNISKCLEDMVEWEKEFALVYLEDEDWAEPFSILKGAVSRQVAESARIQDFIADCVKKVAAHSGDGTLTLNYNLVFDLPEEFEDNFNVAMDRLREKKGL
ncbi:hypothetical protein [Litoreibacter ponti]|nr:hypothetical protein [Litoreibacter ponti]